MENVIFDIQNFRFVDEKESDEEFASVSMNPTFRWCKFILTDDKPNLNKRRIPLEEFDNLVRSGINAPIKMEVGQIGDHAESRPIGVIAALRKNNNMIEGLGALWSEERPEDVAMIKDLFDKGQTLNLSWEVIYGEKVPEENDVIALKNTALRATTFVKLPAYAGRTPVTDFASVEKEEVSEFMDESAVWTTAYINDLPDSSFLYIEPGGEKDSDGKTTPRSLRHFPVKDANGKIDLPHLRNALARIPQSNVPDAAKAHAKAKAERMLQGQNSSLEDIELDELEQAKARIAELEALLVEKETALSSKDAEIAQLKSDNESLASFKTTVEQEKAQAEKIVAIRAKFSEAGIEKPEEFYVDNRERLLAMDETALDFMLQELVSFASTAKNTSNSSVSLPNFSGAKPRTAKELGIELRNSRK